MKKLMTDKSLNDNLASKILHSNHDGAQIYHSLPITKAGLCYVILLREYQEFMK